MNENLPQDSIDISQLGEPANHLVIATDMLQEMICHLGACDGGFDNEEFDRIFYVALKVKHDAKSLQELIDKMEGDAIQAKRDAGSA